MSTTEQSIKVNVPVNTAYNQWTQFESFPEFMEGVKDVQQKDDTHLHWVADIGGMEKEWDAEITTQVPDERIGWRSTSGPRNEGVVTFQQVDDNTTNINLHMHYEPEEAAEEIGDATGALSARVEADLERFKQFIESRGEATGAWRGNIGH